MRRDDAILDALRDVVVDMDFDRVAALCQEAIAARIPAFRAVSHGLARGMELVGERYERNEFFLAELITAGELMKEGMKVLEPHLQARDAPRTGTIVVGTVRRDLHDIGKNVFVSLLTASGIQVVDLGVDVAADQFVDAVRRHDADIVGMSALLSTTLPEMGQVVSALRNAGLRPAVKVIIGGAPVTPAYADHIGADHAARDAVDGVTVCRSWLSMNGNGQ
jgi:5-methyltetrahydrofolate--homocysteine methyltransferase